MANRQFYQFLYSTNPMLTYLEGRCNIGSSGAVSSVKGGGISNVVRLSAGVYKIIFENNYNKVLAVNANLQAPVTGSNVAATALVPGTVYQITALGTTTQANWETAGVPSGVTAAVGLVFLAAATSSGNGTAKELGTSGISAIEVIGDSNKSIISTTSPYLVIKCLAATNAGDTTLIAADPASGSVLSFDCMFRNSSLPGKGES